MNQSSTLNHVSSDPLLEGIAIATNQLLTISDDCEAVQQALITLGNATLVDRIYIFENHSHPEIGENCLSQRWEWVAPGIIPEINNPTLQCLSYAQFFMGWYQWLVQGKIVAGRVEDFPKSEREFLVPKGIQSILVLPIIVRDSFWGFIGFDDCHHPRTWQPAEKTALLAVGGSIGGAIIQRRREAKLRQQNQLLDQRLGDRTQELQQCQDNAEQCNQILESSLQDLQHLQSQLVQTKQLSTLGRLVAGIAQEITNPISFIYGNLEYAEIYLKELLQLLGLYQDYYPAPPLEIKAVHDTIDLAFIREDLPKILESMRLGSNQIVDIVRSLRTFSRTNESQWQAVDLNAQLNDTLTILKMRMKGTSAIQVVRDYGDLPLVECYSGQLSQVFIHILTNAIDALRAKVDQRQDPDFQGIILIRTHALDQSIVIRISDNGPGLTKEVQNQLFQPLFSTKSQGDRTGLGMAIAHQVMTQKHNGTLSCTSEWGEGTTFTLTLPIKIADVAGDGTDGDGTDTDLDSADGDTEEENRGGKMSAA